MTYKAILLLFLTFTVNLALSQNTKVKSIGIPFIQNYSPAEYAATSQNWDGVIDSRGILYVANNNCVLEYDGTTWRRLEIPTATAKSLVLDHNDRLFIGSSGEIGYFQNNEIGVLEYISLTNMIPEKHQNFGDVFSTYMLDSSVVFQTPQSILVYNGDSIVALSNWKSGDAEFLLSHKINNRVFVSTLDYKLYEVVKKQNVFSLSEILDGSSMGIDLVFSMLPYSETEMLLLTKQGAHVYNLDKGTNEKWETEANSWSVENGIYRAVSLKNGNYILGSMSGGAIITDSSGKIIQILNTQRGIVDNTVISMLNDQLHNLWLMTNNGISYVEIGSPFTKIGEELGIEGQVLGLISDGSEIYVGTNQGLYHTTKQDLNNPQLTNPFKKNPGIVSQVLHIDKFDGLIAVGTGNGLRQIGTNGQITELGSRVVWDFVSTVDFPNKIFACNSEGHILVSDIETEKLEFTRNLGSIGNGLNYIVYHGDGLFLTGNWYNGVYSFRLNADLTKIVDIKTYTLEDGLPNMGGNAIYKVNGEISIGTMNGIYRFDEVQDRFFPDTTYVKSVGNQHISVIQNDSNGTVYFNSNNGIGAIYNTDVDTTYCNYCFNDLIDKTIFRIFPYDDGEMIFAGGSQLIHFDPKINKDYVHPKPYQTLVRSVEIMGKTDSLLFGGFNSNTQINSYYPSSFGDFRFTYSAPYFKNSNKTQYSYMLEGQDEYWSTWSTITSKEYTNLTSGQYSFKVKAKNVFGQISETAQYKFNIHTPYYLTIWAYVFYVLIAILVVWLIVKLNSIRLKKENERLENTILERTEEIRYQAEKLQTLDNAKSRFFANISHELRTPLTLIQGPLESILNGSLGKVSDTVKSNLDLSRASTKKLLNLVEEILDLSKLEAGKLELKLESVKFSDLINRIFYTYQSSSEAKRIELKLDYNLDEDLIFKIDIGKLEKILDNLLSNAIKFTESGGEIKMIVNQVEEKIKLQVADNGIGIDKSELNQIFDRFYQAGKENKYSGGTGIGLSLANELTELMDGKLELDSELNMGTTFTLTIPLIAGDIEDIIDYQKDESEKIPQPIEIDFGDPTKFKNARILVVEDNEMMRMYIKKQMSSLYQVDEAEDGIEALDQIAQHKYDLIITDLMMPRLDGYDLVAKLREKENTKDISIIMLTARAADEDIVEGLHIGVDDYMTKPFNPTELKARVHNILNNRSSRLESDKDEVELSANDKLVLELKQTILDHLSDRNFNVSVLADKSAISERQLNRNIKKITGLTAGNFIKEVRLNEARILLEHKSYNTISEVAYAVGFEKPGYFSEVYSKRFGKRPADYLA